jgi:hypothetical protein
MKQGRRSKMEERVIFEGRVYRNVKLQIVCDGEKHWKQFSDGSRVYEGKCKDSGNCPNKEEMVKILKEVPA